MGYCSNQPCILYIPLVLFYTGKQGFNMDLTGYTQIQIHHRRLWGPLIPMAFVFIILVIATEIFLGVMLNLTPSLIYLIYLAMGFMAFLKQYFDYRGRNYFIRQEEVVVTGRSRTKSVAIQRVAATSVTQGFMGRKFNYGTLMYRDFSSGRDEGITYVMNPYDMYNILLGTKAPEKEQKEQLDTKPAPSLQTTVPTQPEQPTQATQTAAPTYMNSEPVDLV